MRELCLVPCKIERGAFTQERTFHISLSDDIVFEGEHEGELIGTAHLDYLRNAENRSLGEDDPPYGEVIDGYVTGRKIRQLGDRVLVEVPSADVIHVSPDSLISADRGD